MNPSEKPLISIIIPTYNSSKTLETELASIRQQDLDQNLIEILVVDGGSTDSTFDIAKKYNATILDNPRRLPLPAICKGLNDAKGRYGALMGADEAFINPSQLRNRMAVFAKYPELKCMLADRLLTPKGMGFSCSYVNTFGDPFTRFVARIKGTMIENLKRNLYLQDNDTYLFRFDQYGAALNGDAGTTIFDMDYVRREFAEEMKTEGFAAMIFFEVVRKSRCTAVIKGDNIMHYSAASFKVYLKKLVYRIINNIFDVEQSGYAQMAVVNPSLSRRKYLYPFYCLTIVLPLYDAVASSIKFKDARLLAHPFYCYYVLFNTLWMYFRKAIGQNKKNNQYVSG